MIRCTIELVPRGIEEAKRTMGIVEITNIAVLPGNYGEYIVSLKKSPPFRGMLRDAWRRGRLQTDENLIIIDAKTGEDDEVIVAKFGGFHRTRRGVYDLLFIALRACGLESRNPKLTG